MKAITFEELRNNRNELIEVHLKNNFTDGIHALLTDLYPDTAHFIYELMQNAEDMNATAVRFILNKKGIAFEHNGTKRAFNLDDIDAITNIGHNRQKKDDPTSIGKFGIGFKAVFAYTSTPIIHSGGFHFKIENYFVPNDKDVPHVSTKDKDGISWTKFSFPFNSPKKPPETAYEECQEGLEGLDESSILFLQNIKTIEYSISDGSNKLIECILDENNEHRITVKSSSKNDPENVVEARWLRFCEPVDIIDDQGNPKNLSIAAAYKLTFDEQSKKDKIEPVSGKTFIYFPAEKEHSGLRFHINAPFASTVARESVRKCDENDRLIQDVSKLIVNSLREIKKQNLMNHSFFEVLPNKQDDLSELYKCIFNDIYDAFQENKYLPAKQGGYVKAVNALSGPAAIYKLLKESDIQQLTGIDKKWIKNASQTNSDADRFIRSLNTQRFDYTDFINIFLEDTCRFEYFLMHQKDQHFQIPDFNPKHTEELLRQKTIDWLKEFYILCHEAYNKVKKSLHTNRTDPKTWSNYRLIGRIDIDRIDSGLKSTAFIKSANGSMYKPSEIYILPPNTSPIPQNIPIVDNDIFKPTKSNSLQDNNIKSFFQYTLGIKEYGLKIEIEKLLQKYDGEDTEIYDKEEYFSDLITFAEYSIKHSDIDFKTDKYYLFLGIKPSDEDVYIVQAQDVFLGTAYGNKHGELLAKIYEKSYLWDGYAEKYNKDELQKLIRFVKESCASNDLLIINQPANYNPLFREKLASRAKPSRWEHSSDWTIPELQEILEDFPNDLEISQLIWETLENNDDSKYIHAEYSPNSTTDRKTCDSSLIYFLKRYAWIPDKEGKMHKPDELSASDLGDGFNFNPDSPLIKALGINCMNEILAELDQKAKENGHRIVPEEEYNRLKKLAEEHAKKEVTALSSKDLLNKQNKASVQDINDGDEFFSDGAVSNIPRRVKSIENTFSKSTHMKPAERKLFSKIEESTKEERNMLSNWYHGKCQMCDTQIKKFNKKPHFIAKNIIHTQHLSDSIRQTTALAWNSLCLCPNCAAKYTVCSRNLDGLYEQIMQTEIIEGEGSRIELTIELDDKQEIISYIPKHFLALKTVMQLIDKEIEEKHS